ncbi:NADP-dependent oxidoreductase [Amycolatopsis sp. FU40]|uniref:NADP-dependent oxidoreductase n=1 Tax=Amycolatopsis sp. FU40 TaxID=2914159 RepID=UPI001F22D348|nr:NADP-dependent oxidoreductase [Amycolatopsis sp. FU40]UKD59122.1 NADP-dependent oxidoreductase [Amycolatopsis sp. FU40]
MSEIPTVMRAAAIDEFGPAELLTVHQVPTPLAEPGQVLVRVEAAGVQPTDVAIRDGWTPPGATVAFPQILGNEFAGTIVQVGAGVTEFETGQQVSGFRVLGCYAEYVTAPVGQVVVKPEKVDWLTAGALSASGQTAHTALERLGARSGETILIHGAAGGVGSMAVQLARHRGLRVIGTGSAGNQEYLRTLGAIPVVYGEGELGRLREAAPKGIDLALDTAGHGNLRTAAAIVADRGRIGSIVEPPLAAELGGQWITSDRSAQRLRELLDLCARGELRVAVRAEYPLDDAASAHRDVAAGHGRGKVVLRIG